MKKHVSLNLPTDEWPQGQNVTCYSRRQFQDLSLMGKNPLFLVSPIGQYKQASSCTYKATTSVTFLQWRLHGEIVGLPCDCGVPRRFAHQVASLLEALCRTSGCSCVGVCVNLAPQQRNASSIQCESAQHFQNGCIFVLTCNKHATR